MYIVYYIPINIKLIIIVLRMEILGIYAVSNLLISVSAMHLHIYTHVLIYFLAYTKAYIHIHSVHTYIHTFIHSYRRPRQLNSCGVRPEDGL